VNEVLERRFAAIGARLSLAPRPWNGSPRIDVRSDRAGELFDIRFGGNGGDADVEVVDLNARDRIRSAAATRCMYGWASGSSCRGRHCGSSSRRSCETSRFRAAVASRTSCSSCTARAGTAVWINDGRLPGISEARYERLTPKQRTKGRWVRFVRDPEVYAKGTVRHPDHATIELPSWHRVLMNTEQGARAMRHVAFLD
jgi:hypothetical protein